MSNLKKYVDSKKKSFPHLYRDVDSQDFWVVIRIGKNIKKRNLNTTDYADALGKISDVIKDLGAEPTKEIRKASSVKLCRDYWSSLRKEKIDEGTAEKTMLRFDGIWTHDLEGFWGIVAPKDIRPEMASEFVAWRKKKRPDIQFYNTFKYLNNLMRYMVRTGAIVPQQVPRFIVPKSEQLHHDRKKGRVVTPSEFKALSDRALNERAWLFINLGYYLGPRQMEIGKLEKDRLEWHDDRLFLVLDVDDTKTGLARTLPLPKFIAKRLWAFAEESDSKFVFPAKKGSIDTHAPSQVFHGEWTETKTRAKIKGKMRFHDLRGTAATNMAKANVNPILACTLLGMSFKTYQKNYLNLSGRDLILTVDSLCSGRVK